VLCSEVKHVQFASPPPKNILLSRAELVARGLAK
jgi:hypothetical protein